MIKHIFRHQSKTTDEPRDYQLKEIENNLLEYNSHPIQKGRDKLKNGIAEFGSPTNPIPVNGVMGEFKYINRLRSIADGARYLFHRRFSFFSEQVKAPVDLFELVSSTGKEWRQICLSPYYSFRSTQSPSFATLVERDKQDMKSKEVYWQDRYVYGVYYTASKFPENLADTYLKTIFNLVSMEDPYKPIGEENGMPVYRCANQITINSNHKQRTIAQAVKTSTEIDNLVSCMLKVARENWKSYKESSGDFCSILSQNQSISNLREARIPDKGLQMYYTYKEQIYSKRL